MKEIKDYLHLYVGCTLRCDTGFVILMSVIPEIIPHTSFGIAVINGSESYRTNLGDYMPVLRPLSDITEEEAIELVKISEWKQYGEHPHKREYRAYRNGFNEIVVSWGESIREKNVPVAKEVFGFEEFRYLLSKGFDLFNLITEGLAIDKTTTKK